MRGRAGMFIANGALLALMNILMRAVAVSFNAYVSRKLGAEGMGLLTLIMSVYSLAVTLATSGVNLSSVRLTAQILAKSRSGEDERASLRRAMRACVMYSLIFGVPAAIGLYFSSDMIAEILLGDARCIPSLRALSVSLPAMSVSSALAGYFTGASKIYKNAAVTLFEQFVKITLTSAGLVLIAPAGLEYAALAVVGGASIAEGASLAMSALLYFRDKRIRGGRAVTSAPSVLGKVFSISMPVAAGLYVRQGLLTLEHLAVPRCLRMGGASSGAALASYGVLHGMVFPLLLFPSAVLGAYSALLIPELQRLDTLGERAGIARVSEVVFRVSLLFSIGTAGIFIAFAGDIGQIFYSSGEAGRQLGLLAPLIPVMYLDGAVDGILKGLGEQVYSMKVNILDSVLSLILVLILVPRFGIDGYIFTILACEIINAALSISRLIAVTRLRVRLMQWMCAPFVSIIIATAAVKLASMLPVPLIGIDGIPALRLAAAGVIYLAMIGGARIFSRRADTRHGKMRDSVTRGCDARDLSLALPIGANRTKKM